MIEKSNKTKSCSKKTEFDDFRSDNRHSGQTQRGMFLQNEFLTTLRQERVNYVDLPTSMEAARATHIPTHHPQGRDPSHFTGGVRFGVETKESQATTTVRTIRQERVNYMDLPTSMEAARAIHIPTHHPQGRDPSHFTGGVRFGVETIESQATVRNITQERVNYMDLPTSVEAARATHIPAHHPQGRDSSHFTGRVRFAVEFNKESQATATEMHVHQWNNPKTRTKRMPDSEMRRILDAALPLPRIPLPDGLAVVRITPSKPRVLKPWAPPDGHLRLVLGGQNLTQKRSDSTHLQINTCTTRNVAGMLASDDQDQFKKPMGLLERIKLLEAKSQETSNKPDEENRPVSEKIPREKLFKSAKEKGGNLECATKKSGEKLLDNVILFPDDLSANVPGSPNSGLEPLSASPRDESFNIFNSISGVNSFSTSPCDLLEPLDLSSLVPPLDLSCISSDRSTELHKAEKELFISVLDDSERDRHRQTKIIRPECVPRLDLSLLEESHVKTSKRIKAKKSERAANKDPPSLNASTRFLIPLGDFDLSANDKIFRKPPNSVAKMPFFFETKSVPIEHTPKEAPVPVICTIKSIKRVPGNHKLRAKMAGTALLPDLNVKKRGNVIKKRCMHM